LSSNSYFIFKTQSTKVSPGKLYCTRLVIINSLA